MSVSEERLVALKALAERPGSEIDSYIPELDVDFFKTAAVVRSAAVEPTIPLAADAQPLSMTVDEEASFMESLTQAERGEFATDAEVRAVWAKHRL
ncbi:hypothetical protein [Beijerinckia sp. L45]|uniref:hypothetical protein n=1 Tax=Beijerinckia sp. L45 TaxID=1641855 RepID=UPI00131C39F4|nr:hypothetical protein [Beijerinckia sp. L45]